MTLLGAESYLHALPTCCHDLACSLAGLLITGRRNSAGFRRRLAAFAERSRWQPARVEEYRDRRLRAFIEHAARAVPYYRALFARLGLTPADFRGLAAKASGQGLGARG